MVPGGGKVAVKRPRVRNGRPRGAPAELAPRVPVREPAHRRCLAEALVRVGPDPEPGLATALVALTAAPALWDAAQRHLSPGGGREWAPLLESLRAPAEEIRVRLRHSPMARRTRRMKAAASARVTGRPGRKLRPPPASG